MNRAQRNPAFKNNLYFISLAILSIFLRLFRLGNNAFWYDESGTLLSNWGLDRLPSFTKLFDFQFLLHRHDYLALYTHGFLYYWRLLFGQNEFSLRLSSVLFSVLSVVALFLLARKYFSLKVAQISILLMSIASFHIYYAQELRPYSAICFLGLLAAYSLLAWQDKGRAKYLFIYALANILSIYFHYMMLLVFFAFMAFLIVKNTTNKAVFRQLITTHLVVIIFILPLTLNIIPNLFFFAKSKLLSGFSEFPIWAGKIGVHSLFFTLKNFSIGYNVEFFSLTGIVATLVYGTFLFLGVVSFYRRTAMQLFVFILLIPVTFLFLFSMFKTCYLDRYFFALFPFFILAVSAGLSRLNKKLLVFFLSVIIALNIFALKRYYSNSLPVDVAQHPGVPKKQDFRGAVEFLSKNYRKGDRIIHTCKNSVFPVKLYTKWYSGDSDLIEEVDRGTVVFLSTDSKNLLTFDYNLAYPVTSLEGEHNRFDGIGRKERVWLFYSFWAFPYPESREQIVVDTLTKGAVTQKRLAKFKDVYLYFLVGND